MRKIPWQIITIFIIVLSLAKCDKVFDEEIYCGDWSFESYYKDYFVSNHIISQDTTYCQGQIVKGDKKGELIVYYHPSKYKIIKIESNGLILNTQMGVYDYFGGKFDGRNKFRLTAKSGDLSHRHDEEIYGER